MSQNHEPPIDPTHEPGAGLSQEHQARIEGQLKKSRPQPVELDADELLRLAGMTPTPASSTAPSPRSRRYRSAALAAGSWACGAIVGGIVMFLAMRQDVQAIGPPAETAGGSKEPLVNLVQEEKTPDPSHGEFSALDAAVLALTVPGSTTDLWDDELCLQPGMSLPSTWKRLAVPGDVDRHRPASAALKPTPIRPGSDPLSSPGITREQLMRDMLEESSGSVL